MALAIADTKDLSTFYGNVEGGGSGFSLFVANSNGRYPFDFAYYPRLERLYMRAINSASSVDNAYVDPLFLDATNPKTKVFDRGTTLNSLVAGEWDRFNNTQRLYGKEGATDNPILELNPETLDIIDTDAYPNVGWQSTRSGLTSSDDGYYDTAFGHFVIMETVGKAFCPRANVRQDGQTWNNVPCEIDLSTGHATIIPEFFARHESSPNKFQAPQFAGSTFQLTYMQFVEDDESTLSKPKGFMFLASNMGGSSSSIIWVKIIDWNPFGVSGTPTRIHKRTRLLSRVEGLSSTIGDRETFFFHPPTRSIRGVFPAGPDLIVTGTTPALASITAPTALRTVKTNKAVDFSVTTLGSLGERISGIDVSWVLKRASTEDEELTVSGGVGTTSTVDNPPIDDDGALVVKADGTELVEGTDYSVNLSTGEITWQTDQSGATLVTASYNHRTNPVTPAHGTLLTSASASDINGAALARVEYPDDDTLAGELDQIEATA